MWNACPVSSDSVSALRNTWVLIGIYRRGFKLAIMTDGLLLNLPGFDNELIPWSDVSDASPDDLTISVRLKTERKIILLGSDHRIFPTPDDAARCAAQINERIRGAHGAVTIES